MGVLRSFFESRFFDYQFRFRVHLVQLTLVIIIMGVAVGKILTLPNHRPSGRSDIIALSMGGKSLGFLAYIILTSHVARFKRWQSLKAYAVLETLDVVFWSGVVGFAFMSIMKSCTGTSCVFSWLVAILSWLMIKVCFWSAVIAWKDRRYFKQTGLVRGEAAPDTEAYQTQSTTLSDRAYRK